jgi:hypothetical protein
MNELSLMRIHECHESPAISTMVIRGRYMFEFSISKGMQKNDIIREVTI